MSKKILVLTPRLPYPLEGGDKIRIYYVAKSLKEAGFDLTLLSFAEHERDIEASRSPVLASVFSSIHVITLPKWKSYLNVLFGFFTGKPLQVLYYYSKAMQAAVSRETASGAYSAVLAHLIRMAPYAMSLPVSKKVLEMTDALSLNYARSKEQGSRGFLGVVYRIEGERVKAYERKCVKAFDRSVVVSPVDREHLLKGLPAAEQSKVSVVPIGVPGEIKTARARPYDPELIVFFGNLRTHQNNDAALYFANNTFPMIQEKRPGAKFRVIGANPSPAVQALRRRSGIEVTGRVERIAEHAERAGVSVCPIRIGAGMKGKVLESMAMEIPVVTTAMGAEGIEGARSGEQYFIADTPAEFAKAVLALMENGDLNDTIGRNGRDFVSEHYRYDVIGREYAKFF